MITIFLLILIYSTYSVSRKLGMEGWELFVPGYRFYKLVEIATGNGWLCFLLFIAAIPIAGWIFLVVIAIVWDVKISQKIAKLYNGNTAAVFFIGMFYVPCHVFKDAPNCDDPINRAITKLFGLKKEDTASIDETESKEDNVTEEKIESPANQA